MKKNKIEDINSRLTALIEELLRTIKTKLHRYLCTIFPERAFIFFRALFIKIFLQFFHIVIQIVLEKLQKMQPHKNKNVTLKMILRKTNPI